MEIFIQLIQSTYRKRNPLLISEGIIPFSNIEIISEMEEGPAPSSTSASTSTEHVQNSNHNLYGLLIKTMTYGEMVWNKISEVRGTGVLLSPLLNITLVIEEQLQNIYDILSLSQFNHPKQSKVTDILQFYTLPELQKKVKNHTDSLYHQIHYYPAPRADPAAANYYSVISPIDYTMDDLTQISTSNQSRARKNHNDGATKSYFVEDLDVTEVSDIVRESMKKDRQAMEEEGVTETPLAPQTTNFSLDIPVAQHLRINIIRHRFARNSEMTTLKLFQSFIHTLRKVDKNISILPYDSKKQQYTALINVKQIDTLNEHQLKLYFQPWHREQYYSLSGFIHLSSMLSYDEIFSQPPIIEWLDTYQYSTKKCSSQNEEMAIIGALCYGSTWIYREDLKQHIIQHPEWKKAIEDLDQPIVFDLLLRTFRGSKRSTPMIFISTERSKQDTVREIFKVIYDGTAKTYPRGEMMLFIPTRNGDQFTNEQREKIIFNHETYLGNEEIAAIHGLNNLNTSVTLKGGKTTTIRTLLKSLPATDGMSRNRLFQIVDPNAGQTCTIVTFQTCDRHYIEQRKLILENEIRSVLAPGEAAKIFTEETEGLWFGGHVRKRNGKPINLSIPHKADMEYMKQAESLLNSPPKKRERNDMQQPTTQPRAQQLPTQITYNGMIQAQRTQLTQSVSVNETEGTTTTTTTQMSQTVVATMEARFEVIETEIRNQKEHQTGMDRRLLHLENRTMTIDDNISAMMAHWNINPQQKRKATTTLNDSEHYLLDTEESSTNPHHTATLNMDMGDMDECL